jgi:hypothetical protein
MRTQIRRSLGTSGKRPGTLTGKLKIYFLARPGLRPCKRCGFGVWRSRTSNAKCQTENLTPFQLILELEDSGQRDLSQPNGTVAPFASTHSIHSIRPWNSWEICKDANEGQVCTALQFLRDYGARAWSTGFGSNRFRRGIPLDRKSAVSRQEAEFSH